MFELFKYVSTFRCPRKKAQFAWHEQFRKSESKIGIFLLDTWRSNMTYGFALLYLQRKLMPCSHVTNFGPMYKMGCMAANEGV